MDKPTKEFTDLLLSKGIISLEQLNEATKLAGATVPTSATPW